jgi:hypothetical protein
MTTTATASLEQLYEQDETAWLETMAELAEHGRTAEMDFRNLCEFLTAMAKRDRREVYRRLVILMTHLLKWEYKSEQRSKSWRRTMRLQRSELNQLLDSGTLRNHALDVLDKAYAESRLQATEETELSDESFPRDRPWDLDQLIEDREV